MFGIEIGIVEEPSFLLFLLKFYLVLIPIYSNHALFYISGHHSYSHTDLPGDQLVWWGVGIWIKWVETKGCRCRSVSVYGGLCYLFYPIFFLVVLAKLLRALDGMLGFLPQPGRFASVPHPMVSLGILNFFRKSSLQVWCNNLLYQLLWKLLCLDVPWLQLNLNTFMGGVWITAKANEGSL